MYRVCGHSYHLYKVWGHSYHQSYKCARFATIAITRPYKFIGCGAIAITKPYKFKRCGAIAITKPYKFIKFEAIAISNSYKAIRFGAIAITKPCKFTGFGAIAITKPYTCIGFVAIAITKRLPRGRAGICFWQFGVFFVFGRFSDRVCPKTPLERRRSSCSAGCTNNQSPRPILRPFRSNSEFGNHPPPINR